MKIVLEDGAYLPEKAHPTDAGYDLRTPKDCWIPVEHHTSIDTGVHIQIPEGFVGFIKTKSGLMTKDGIMTEGVIDSGYTGSIVVCVRNLGLHEKFFAAGDKIAQLVILPIGVPDSLEVVDNLEDTARGPKGFGSSGK